MGTGYGNVEYGDLNALYYQMFFKVDPRYQLILVGDYPNARYFSVSLNDAHSALSTSILDTNIMPLTADYTNPFQPGLAFIAGQQYAVPINFGGTPGQVETGCMTSAYNVDVNGLDATQRHPGMDWNSDTGFFQLYPLTADHVIDTPQHTNPNTAGLIMVRVYLNNGVMNKDNNPHIIVRDVASGCAYPADYALNTLQVVASTNAGGEPWLDSSQYSAHHLYETDYLPKLCNAPVDPMNSLRWTREPEYIPVTNPNAGYVVSQIPKGLTTTLALAGEVMRIRVQIPSVPPTPCTNGCSRSGNEQMRYMSLSFVGKGGSTLASLADTAFTKDANGYATLIVGTGAKIPSWITPANGYTYLDLTTLSGYEQFNLLALRHIIPSNNFNCAAQFVPYRTSVDTPSGSLLGDYTPVVDYPAAATLPETASPLTQPSACGTFPAGEPGIRPLCGVSPSPPPAVSSAITQCTAPGCTQFAAQPNPPITIIGSGFGTFPGGAPFTGISSYLAVVNQTQHWSAGSPGNPCTVSISEWDTTAIQFVANVGQNDACPLKSGDRLKIALTNPETGVQTQFKVTAQ